MGTSLSGQGLLYQAAIKTLPPQKSALARLMKDSSAEALSSQMTPSFINLAIRANQDSSPSRNSKNRMHSFPVSTRHGAVGLVALSYGAHCWEEALLYWVHFLLSMGPAHLPPASLVWFHFAFLSKEIVSPNQILLWLNGGWLVGLPFCLKI